LLGISVVVALVLHYLLKYRTFEGFEGFLGKVIVGWLGAWLGSPVFGHWPANLSFADVYPIPALLGSLSSVFSAVLFLKTLSSVGVPVRGKAVTAETIGEQRKGVA
jgi:uncharacterized membrane protein YeaQ/YmgE (transglycosylase-associated protein family)